MCEGALASVGTGLGWELLPTFADNCTHGDGPRGVRLSEHVSGPLLGTPAFTRDTLITCASNHNTMRHGAFLLSTPFPHSIPAPLAARPAGGPRRPAACPRGAQGLLPAGAGRLLAGLPGGGEAAHGGAAQVGRRRSGLRRVRVRVRMWMWMRVRVRLLDAGLEA